MMFSTCLLISDDPDDHAEFSEALDEAWGEAVLVAVSRVSKALDLLLLKRCIPEYIFLNAGMADFEPERFFLALSSDSALMKVKVVSFGEVLHFDSPQLVRKLESDLSFSQLKDALRSIIAGSRI